jgi:hypothetical protein
MKLVVAKEPLRRILRWTQRGLFAVGIAVLAYCGFVLIDAWSFQQAERRQFEYLISSKASAPAPCPAG